MTKTSEQFEKWILEAPRDEIKGYHGLMRWAAETRSTWGQFVHQLVYDSLVPENDCIHQNRKQDFCYAPEAKMDNLTLEEIGQKLEYADGPLHIVECQNCGWAGDEDELLALSDGLNEFIYCPECNSDKIEDW